MTTPQLRSSDVFYPESDGKPLGETGYHVEAFVDLFDAARRHFRGVPDVLIGGNNFFYWEEGNPRLSVVPDFYIVRGVRSDPRRIYKVWEEGKGPDFIVELSSASTFLEDLGTKRVIYETLGVQEYFLFDPEADKLDPPLQGFRRRKGRLEPLEDARSEDGYWVLFSEFLGLELRARGIYVRLYDPSAGRFIPVSRELSQVLAREQRRAENEAERAETEAKRAETEARRAETEADRAKTAAQRAESMAGRAETERLRAEAEGARADAAEAELARLRRQIAGS